MLNHARRCDFERIEIRLASRFLGSFTHLVIITPKTVLKGKLASGKGFEPRFDNKISSSYSFVFVFANTVVLNS